MKIRFFLDKDFLTKHTIHILVTYIMMDYLESEIDIITEDCIKLYHSLPKNGKPVENEWTVLSCVIEYDQTSKQHKIVSLGTGSKCIGASKMLSSGNIVNDSHAEIIARRGFLLYLYENILYVKDEKPSVFTRERDRFKLKDNIKFLFYSSQMPCGDASIIPKDGEQNAYGNVVIRGKRDAVTDICDIERKKVKMDIHRTGAKCLTHDNQDPKEPGEGYHIIGQVRTKPGRGDQTLSVSCSDKMAKWIHLGIQGRLLSLIVCEPIFISCFIFGSGTPYSEETLHRALLYRDSKEDLQERLQIIPVFYKSSIVFPHIRTSNNIRPASGSIIWVDIQNRTQEVAVQGIKLGVTKKTANSLNHCLSICKYRLYKMFIDILIENKELKKIICNEELLKDIPYNKMKRKAIVYQEKWSKLMETFFKTWTVKPDIWNFCVNIK